MTRSGRIFTGIGFVLLALIVLVIVLWDWNWFKPLIERKASSATGDDVKINGDLKVQMGWVPVIELSQIEVSNPHWQGDDKDKQIAKIDDLKVSIELKKLLTGDISLPEILITKPDLTLRRVALGQSNWESKPPEERAPASRAAVPEIGKLEITDGTIDYQDSVKGLKMNGKISTVEGNGGNADDKVGFTLNGNGVLDKDALIIKAGGGPLLDLTDTTKPYPIDIDITLEKTRLKVDGTITDPTKLSDLDATMELEGPSTGELFVLLNIPAPETPPYHVKGHLLHKDKSWTYENFTGTIGGSDIAGTVGVDTSHPRMFVKADLLSQKLDLNDIGPLVGIPPGAKAATDEQKKAAAAYHADERVLPDAKLSLGKVRSVDADLTFKASSVLAPNLPLDNVDLHLTLDNGVLTLDPLKLGVAGGQIDSIIKIDARADKVETDYDIRFHNFELNRFMTKAGFPDGGTGKLGGRVKLKAPGNSVRESLGNADGIVGLVMDKGQISDLVVALVGIDIGEALKLVVTDDKSKLIPVRCLATYFDVKDGLMTPQAFVLDTSTTSVEGKGSINLKDEHLDLQLIANQKDPAILAAPTPIDIDGTFKHPTFGLDTKSLVERGGAALALGVLLTPIGSLLAFVDPGEGEDTNCAALLNDIKTAKPGEQLPTRPPAQPAPPEITPSNP